MNPFNRLCIYNLDCEEVSVVSNRLAKILYRLLCVSVWNTWRRTVIPWGK